MPALQVRDFPQPLYDELKAYAAENHRSIAQQVIVAVEDMIHPKPQITAVPMTRAQSLGIDTEEDRQARIKKRKAIFARFEELSKNLPDDLPDPVEIVRESRRELEERSERCLPETLKGRFL